jgi:hypothetical protein
MTPNSTVPSDTDRLAEIRRRDEHQLMVDRSLDTIAARDHAAAVDDRAELLSIVDRLQGRLDTAEGQLAKAREEAIADRGKAEDLGARLKQFLADQFSIANEIKTTEDKGEQQRLLGLAEARATLRAMLDGCDDFMVSRVRACTGCGKCDYCTARGITARGVLGLGEGDGQ